MSASIVQLHRPRTCLGCEHYSTGDADTVESKCVMWAEPIDDETVGAECSNFLRRDPA